MNTLLKEIRRTPLLMVIVFLALGSPLFGVEFDIFKSKSKSKDVQAAAAARLKEIGQATKGFADRYVTYLVDFCDKVEKDNS